MCARQVGLGQVGGVEAGEEGEPVVLFFLGSVVARPLVRALVARWWGRRGGACGEVCREWSGVAWGGFVCSHESSVPVARYGK